MADKITFQAEVMPLSEVTGSEEDNFRATVRTINPDQTGFTSHTEVKRSELPAFWLGVNAVARTWQMEGIKIPDVPNIPVE